MDASDPTAEDNVRQRVATVLTVASRFDSELALSELTTWLPVDGPRDAASLAEWVRGHPATAETDGSFVRGAGTPARSEAQREDRRARGGDYLAAARELFGGPLISITPLIRCGCVTGSTAYLEPAPGDDVDLMVVTAPGALWVALLRVFLALRRTRAAGRGPVFPWCVNYVLDEREAIRAYTNTRGFMFAREALTAHPVVGEGYYAGLVRDAPWMKDELPRMYARWAEAPRTDRAPPVPRLGDRLASVAAYLCLAPYLQLVGLVRNHSLRRNGRAEEGFRTITRWRTFALQTQKFERLQTLVEPHGASAGRSPTA